jgi:hypothetical protein
MGIGPLPSPQGREAVKKLGIEESFRQNSLKVKKVLDILAYYDKLPPC